MSIIHFELFIFYFSLKNVFCMDRITGFVIKKNKFEYSESNVSAIREFSGPLANVVSCILISIIILAIF